MMGHFERYEDADTKQDPTLPIPPVPVVTVWDMAAPGGPTEIKLDPTSAREFMERDSRYVTELLSGVRIGGGHE
jgi:hypothetical protein